MKKFIPALAIISLIALGQEGGCDTDEDGDGWTVSDGDCDDANSDVHPGADEVCDSVDNNCDRNVDEELLGSEEACAGQTCQAILEDTTDPASGMYWIQPSDADDAFQVYCDMELLDGGWTRIAKASTISGIWSSEAIGTPSESGEYKLSDARINTLLSLNNADYNVYLKCGDYAALIQTGEDFIWNSAGRSDGTCEAAYNDGENDASCYPETSEHYYGVFASLGEIPPGATFGGLVSILYPGTYGSSYYPCRIHELGDYALDYYVR